jgi:hypothetical protein
MSNLDPGACLRDRCDFLYFFCCCYVYKDVLTSRLFCSRSAPIPNMNLSAQVRGLVVFLHTLFVSLFSLSWIYNGSQVYHVMTNKGCTSLGICCPPGSKCGPAGSTSCCPSGGKLCGDGERLDSNLILR